MAETEPNLEQLKLPAERPPFAGFLYRLLAFILDCVLLYFIFKGLASIARPALLALNPALPWLGHLLVFLYFWICASPLTRGQTAAQALFNIRVVGRDGNPIGWAAAARRALIQQGVFLVFIMVYKPAYECLFPARLSYPVDVAFVVINVSTLTFIVALAMTVIFHPLKRGWHDLWAGSFVTSSPVPPAFFRSMETAPDVVVERKIANFARMSLIFWAVATIALLLTSVRHFTDQDQRRNDLQLAALKSEFQLPGYRLVQTVFPDSLTREDAMNAIRQAREYQKVRGETMATTETLMTQLETMVAVVFKNHGAYSPGEVKTPAFRAGIENLRRRMWSDWKVRAASHNSSATLDARGFEAIVFEPLVLVMYNKVELRGRVHGPADPAQGNLIFEDVLSPLPEAVDQKTTASASSEALRTHETPRP